ncbi:hypothetical protein FHS18_002247 [Paenibacillus phyllosphaerae]|uniref:Uncharacterized protein n=1 Tax=Paenibacillus phyllosphaerae TaxID=274593 RepID=A0A7W5AWN7_9BACL|nr:CBO0543 family protein [Paenibacillus phyllosphaerae]MBB3110180.1 hypothetical protein [Paenibacillus phyllosphaerae]
MHVALALFSIFCAWRWADWRNWKLYHPTMLYITCGGFLYEYLTKDQTMWMFHPDFLYNHTVTVVVYAVLTMPLNVLLFLSTFPPTLGKQLRHFAIWIAIYGGMEWVMMITGRISYKNDWGLLHSLLFDLMMFPMLVLHHKRPLVAYALSVPIVWGLLLIFKIKLN